MVASVYLYRCPIFGGALAARGLSVCRVRHLCLASEYRWTMATEKKQMRAKQKKKGYV